METKDSLLMPITEFEMRGNLNKKEPLLVEKWCKTQLYSKINKNKKEEYMLHDGPPYANGAMHCGHALNRTLKDFVVRLKNMEGYKTNFDFGWDTHGLPIEIMVTKSGVNRKTTPIDQFREKCKEYALGQIEKQKKEIQRLGCLGNYDNPYFTMNKEFEANEIKCFATLALKGLIYKGLKPVYWSPSSESALAEAEIEYHDVDSYSIYVSFDVIEGKKLLPNNSKILIWTTTPWTLPANLALCANPSFVYGLYDTDIGKVLFLQDLKKELATKLGWKKCKLVKTFKGKELEKIKAKHPFYDRESLMILGDYVTGDTGTGIVHIAPGHGADDYNVCLKYGIKPYCPVDEHGKMTKDAGSRLEGLFYEDANKEVLKILEENKHLLKVEKINHSYPHDWRTHKPVIFRSTPQWFCSIEPIKDQLIEEIHKVKRHPAWGETRMINMVKDRNDWCISRQRVWGVPIPIIYCEDGTPIIEKEVFDHIEKVIKEKGSNAWYQLDEKDLLPKGYKNQHSPNNKFKKEKDIMDVWFDSGSSWNGVLNERGQKYPADMYLEGNDQYRGWFNSSLILSVAVNGVAPYKEVVTHGFVVDEKWEKMSKSKGNGIDPLKLINEYGADVLRLWAALTDYQQDVKLSESIMKTISDQYRKIRNCFKFMLGNLSNGTLEERFKKKDIQTEFEQLDLYILKRLEVVKNNFIKAMDNFDFVSAMTEVMKLISDDLSSFYFDICKDILYCEDKKSKRRLQVQTVINEILFTLMRLLNPIIPFTMDEVNNAYCLKSEENVQLYSYPTITKNYKDSLSKEYKLVRDLRDDVLKSLEEARTSGLIGKANDAIINMYIFDKDCKKVFSKFATSEKPLLFIVSKVNEYNKSIKNSYKGKVAEITVAKADGIKCDRCWNFFDKQEIKEIEGTHLCGRCLKVMKVK